MVRMLSLIFLVVVNAAPTAISPVPALEPQLVTRAKNVVATQDSCCTDVTGRTFLQPRPVGNNIYNGCWLLNGNDAACDSTYAVRLGWGDMPGTVLLCYSNGTRCTDIKTNLGACP